jgi:hypothetical protein
MRQSLGARAMRGRSVLAVLAIVFAIGGPDVVRGQAAVAPRPPRSLGPQTLDDRSRSELLTAREQVWRAWFAYDSVQLERLLPRDGFLAIGGDSAWQNREQTIEGSRAFARSGGRLVSIAFPRTEMQAFGDVVVIYTTFAYTTEREGQRRDSSGNAVEVFARKDGAWQNPSWYLDFRP